MANPDNPAADTTTVNVKSMPVTAWNRAKAASAKQGETLAEWLARAINQLADREAGQREILPDERPANLAAIPAAPPPGMSPTDLQALATAMQVSAQAAEISVSKAAARHVQALAVAHMRAARGLPAPAPRKPGGKRPLLLDGRAEAPANPGSPRRLTEAENG